MLKKEIIQFDLNSVVEMLQNKPEQFVLLMRSLTDRKLSVKDTGIDRKLLYTWKKEKIVPFADADGWRRFNTIELCWLKLVVKFRSVGLSLEKIKELKDYFFEDSFLDDVVIDFKKVEKHFTTNFNFQINNLSDSKGKLSEDVKKELKKIEASRFMFLLVNIFMKRANMYLYFDSTGKTECIDMNEYTNLVDFHKIFDLITEESVVLINIRKVITEVIGCEKDFEKKSTLSNLISEPSMDLLKNLFLDNNVKEVTMRVNENGRPIVSMKKEMELSELKKEINTLSKKGIFKDVIIKTRDGNIQYFEQIELVKL